jgi:tetratricopeptide (TPR) repeat protein
MTIGRKAGDATELRADVARILDVVSHLRRGVRWVVGWVLGRSRTGYYDLVSDPANAEERAYLLLRRARVAVATGELPLGLDMLNQVLRQLPDLPDAIEARAITLDMMGDEVTAKKEFDRYRLVNANRHYGAADRHYVMRHPRPRTDMLEYEVVVRRVKRRLFPLMAQGNLMLSLGHPAEALTYYDLAARLRTKSNEVVIMRGCALSALGRHAEAIQEFNKVLMAEPNNGDALNSRGIDHMANGNLDAANADWNRQIGLLAADRAAARGCLALRMADYERALPELEQAIARHPGNPYWLVYRATALRRLGRQPAPSCTASVAAAWPGPLQALHSGKCGEAEVLARADNPKRRTEAAFVLGGLALAGEDRNAASRWWREVVEMAPVDMIEYAAARNELARLGA